MAAKYLNIYEHEGRTFSIYKTTVSSVNQILNWGTESDFQSLNMTPFVFTIVS